MVEHVEKQMLQMPMLVVRAEKQMLKVGTWRQMLVRLAKQMGELETGATRPPDATTWGGNLMPRKMRILFYTGPWQRKYYPRTSWPVECI